VAGPETLTADSADEPDTLRLLLMLALPSVDAPETASVPLTVWDELTVRSAMLAYLGSSYTMNYPFQTGDSTAAPRAWVLAGSQDGTNFTLINSQNTQLHVNTVTTFTLPTPSSSIYTYLRLIITSVAPSSAASNVYLNNIIVNAQTASPQAILTTSYIGTPPNWGAIQCYGGTQWWTGCTSATVATIGKTQICIDQSTYNKSTGTYTPQRPPYLESRMFCYSYNNTANSIVNFGTGSATSTLPAGLYYAVPFLFTGQSQKNTDYVNMTVIEHVALRYV